MTSTVDMNNKRIVFAAGPTTERGGPSKYVRALPPLLRKRGFQVSIVNFRLYRIPLPGLRHLVYFFRLIPHALRARTILVFDTWSVGIPALLAAKITGTRFVVRVGGDFLWERYIERTNDRVRLSEFYTTRKANFSVTERFIYTGTRVLLSHADCIAFNSDWQKDIWQQAYGISTSTVLLENYFPTHAAQPTTEGKVFVSAGRQMRMRNIDLLRTIFARIQARHPEVSLDTRHLDPDSHARRLESCYAVVQTTVSDVAPNMIIEAAALGIPFICTEDTGISGRLAGRGLFIPMDEHSIECAIEEILKPEVYKNLKIKASQPGFERSWDQIADEVSDLL